MTKYNRSIAGAVEALERVIELLEQLNAKTTDSATVYKDVGSYLNPHQHHSGDKPGRVDLRIRSPHGTDGQGGGSA